MALPEHQDVVEACSSENSESLTSMFPLILENAMAEDDPTHQESLRLLKGLDLKGNSVSAAVLVDSLWLVGISCSCCSAQLVVVIIGSHGRNRAGEHIKAILVVIQSLAVRR